MGANKETIRPTGNRVLIRRDEVKEMTEGGIVLPDDARDKPKRGVVVSVGEGRILESGGWFQTNLQAGDRVIFRAYGGDEIEHNGETLLVIGVDDILAKVNCDGSES